MSVLEIGAKITSHFCSEGRAFLNAPLIYISSGVFWIAIATTGTAMFFSQKTEIQASTIAMQQAAAASKDAQIAQLKEPVAQRSKSADETAPLFRQEPFAPKSSFKLSDPDNLLACHALSEAPGMIFCTGSEGGQLFARLELPSQSAKLTLAQPAAETINGRKHRKLAREKRLAKAP